MFKRIVLLSAYKKRKAYESLIDSVPMFKQLDVSTPLLFFTLFFTENNTVSEHNVITFSLFSFILHVLLTLKKIDSHWF